MVEQGEPAPRFETTMAEGEGDLGQFALEEALGDGPVVLAFFPAAFSPGCEQEMCQFRDSISAFESVDADVYGISTDMPYALGAFASANDLNFPLLSDFNREIIEAYGVKLDELGGMQGVAERSVFVLDGDGTVTYRWVSDNPADLPEVDEVVDAVEAPG